MPRGQVIDGEAPFVTEVSVRLRLERGLRISLFVALCALLMFGPLALGIVQDWSTALFEAGAAVVLLIWMTWQLIACEVRVRWSSLFAPMLAFFGLIVVQILFHHSAYLYDSLSELWLYIAYAILVFVAVQLVRSDDDFILRFGKTMAVFGSVYAVFAVFQGFTSEGRIYWLIKPRTGGLYGSYVNHNHYAGLMELLLPIALVLAFSRLVREGKRVLLVFATIVMAASVFLCQSRGGMFAVVVETVFLALFWMRQFSPRKSAAVFVAFCLVTAVFLAWIAPQQVGGRITDIHDPARWLIHRDSIRMFAAHPFLGSGFGSFAAAFPRYRAFYDGFFINHAHDDYLELVLETGLAGFGVAVWFIVVLYREGLRNLRPAKRSPAALTSTAALAGCTGLLAHSFIDFNLHIPANAALFYVLCAIATAPPVSRSGSNNSYKKRSDCSASNLG
ncbi:MAG: O-antigen ligase family protein [Terriglobales bacterium]